MFFNVTGVRMYYVHSFICEFFLFFINHRVTKNREETVYYFVVVDDPVQENVFGYFHNAYQF